MTLGEKLSEKRRARGMTQEEVAEKLGVTPQAVSKWENDGSCPDIFLLPAIASLYATTVDDLLSREKTPVATYVPPEQRKRFDDMVLRILAQDNGDRAKVNLPMPLVKLALEMGAITQMNVGNMDLSKIDFASVIKMVESGMIGRLIEIEGKKGETVVVEVV